MNWDQVKGTWKQFRGKVKEQWGHLTDDELDIIDGRRDVLIGKVQEAYGLSKDQAEKQVKEFEERSVRNADNDAEYSRRTRRTR